MIDEKLNLYFVQEAKELLEKSIRECENTALAQRIAEGDDAVRIKEEDVFAIAKYKDKYELYETAEYMYCLVLNAEETEVRELTDTEEAYLRVAGVTYFTKNLVGKAMLHTTKPVFLFTIQEHVVIVASISSDVYLFFDSHSPASFSDGVFFNEYGDRVGKLVIPTEKDRAEAILSGKTLWEYITDKEDNDGY